MDLNDILPAATIMVVSVTASTTQGYKIYESMSNLCIGRSPVDETELQTILEACDMVSSNVLKLTIESPFQGLELNEKKMKILQYVESRMSFIAPNLSAIVGSTIAAKLIGMVN